MKLIPSTLLISYVLLSPSEAFASQSSQHKARVEQNPQMEISAAAIGRDLDLDLPLPSQDSADQPAILLAMGRMAPARSYAYRRPRSRSNRSSFGLVRQRSSHLHRKSGFKLRGGTYLSALSTIFIPIIGMDYVSPFGGQQSWMAGASYATADVDGLAGLSILTFDGGAVHHFEMSRKSSFHLGLRGGMAIVTIEVFGASVSATTTVIYGTAGFNFETASRNALGIEALLPLAGVSSLGGFPIFGTFMFSI